MRLRTPALAFLAFAAVAATPADPATPGAREVVPFIADDYARALAQARSRRLPLFIESWAPW
jgi:hypothetical protein